MAFKATQVVSNNFYDMMRKETLKGGKMVITSYRVIFLTGPPLKMSLDWPPPNLLGLAPPKFP